MITKAPLFSIVTCTKNSTKYLKECLDSVGKQKFRDFEHIIVDGGSQDGTLKIVKKYRASSAHIVKIVNANPKGISHAMNVGIKHSSGKYINHLHSDDLMANSNSLKVVSDCINMNPNINLIVGDCKIFNEASNSKSYIFPKTRLNRFILKHFTYSNLLISNIFPHPSVFINRDLFYKHGMFNEKLYTAMDYEMWLRLASSTRPFIIEKQLSCCRIHPNTFSERNRALVEKEVTEIQERYRAKHILYAILADLIYKFVRNT